MKNAYIEGFCKTAEAYGIHPEALVKAAALFDFKKKKDNKSVRNALGEVLGTLGFGTAGSTLIGSGAGAALGGLSLLLAGKRLPPSVRKTLLSDAATAGAGAGFIAGPVINVGGALTAALTKSRSKKEQSLADSKGHLLRNMFVPGVGSYNLFKRLGRIIANSSED